MANWTFITSDYMLAFRQPGDRILLRRDRSIYVGGVSVGQKLCACPIRFDTHDFEDFYFACVRIPFQATKLPIRSFSPVRVYKYDKSADTFSKILDEDDGEPQLAHPYTDAGDEVFRADNRKNFQVVRRSSKTLIFYRRVESSAEQYRGLQRNGRCSHEYPHHRAQRRGRAAVFDGLRLRHQD